MTNKRITTNSVVTDLSTRLSRAGNGVFVENRLVSNNITQVATTLINFATLIVIRKFAAPGNIVQLTLSKYATERREQTERERLPRYVLLL